jgi:ATP-dependent DNA helicase RecQ
MEEERRVFYVAATRAKETLTVMVRKDRRTPFAGELAGDQVIDRTPRLTDPEQPANPTARRYAIIQPKELFLSYAAAMTEASQVHAAMRATTTGDQVRLVNQGRWIHVETKDGVPIAALSEAGRQEWGPRLASVRTATITAMVHRTVGQEGEAYQSRAQVAAWEFPVVEVCWTE